MSTEINTEAIERATAPRSGALTTKEPERIQAVDPVACIRSGSFVVSTRPAMPAAGRTRYVFFSVRAPFLRCSVLFSDLRKLRYLLARIASSTSPSRLISSPYCAQLPARCASMARR